jgi:thiamine kinase-like enzyme
MVKEKRKKKRVTKKRRRVTKKKRRVTKKKRGGGNKEGAVGKLSCYDPDTNQENNQNNCPYYKKIYKDYDYLTYNVSRIHNSINNKQFEPISDKDTECKAYTSLIQNDNVKHYIPEVHDHKKNCDPNNDYIIIKNIEGETLEKKKNVTDCYNSFKKMILTIYNTTFEDNKLFVHNDLHIGNVLYNKKNDSYLIDFDSATFEKNNVTTKKKQILDVILYIITCMYEDVDFGNVNYTFVNTIQKYVDTIDDEINTILDNLESFMNNKKVITYDTLFPEKFYWNVLTHLKKYLNAKDTLKTKIKKILISSTYGAILQNKIYDENLQNKSLSDIMEDEYIDIGKSDFLNSFGHVLSDEDDVLYI